MPENNNNQKLPKKYGLFNQAVNIIFLMLSFAVFGLAVFSYAPHQNAQPTFTSIEEPLIHKTGLSDDEIFFIQDTISRYLLAQNYNGSVLVARNGQVIMSRSFGFADFRNHTPLQQETPFQLASITKTFTAAAVLMLHNNQELHIDNDVTTYIPEFPWQGITVRQLLNHTAGLQNYMWMIERYWNKPVRPNNEDMLQLFIKYPRGLNFRPGNRFSYSNTGYAFLGLLIERVTGKSYAEFMQQNIFEPLDMMHTFVYNPHCTIPMTNNRAFGFRRWRWRHIIIPDVDHDGVMGDKGIYSNIHDLYKWDRAIANGKLLPDSIWLEAFEYTRLRNNRTVRYGMGWRLQNYMDNHVAHHPGRWNGFRTSLKRFIDDDVTLIMLSNNSRDITHMINRIQNIVFHNEIAARSRPPEEEDPTDYETIGGGN